MAPIEVGKFIEATPNDPKMKNTYFFALIIGEFKKGFMVKYLHVTDDKGDQVIHYLPKWLLRPIPPLVFAPLYIGEDVDVFVGNCWWRGTVTSVLEDFVSVLFDDWGESGMFMKDQVRIHQTWSRKSPSYWKYKKMD